MFTKEIVEITIRISTILINKIVLINILLLSSLHKIQYLLLLAFIRNLHRSREFSFTSSSS